MHRTAFSAAYALLLAAFTAYLLLDTFVIARAELVLPAPQPAETTAPANDTAPAETAAPIITANSYDNGQTSITLTEHRLQNTTVYVAEVALASPAPLQTALAQGTYGRNVTAVTSAIAADAGAVLAINGDYYGARERGYVIRNGTLLRSTSSGSEDLVIWADGSVSIIQESEITAEQLLADGAQQVLAFGPALVENGTVAVEPGDEVGKAMANNPRTAIGITAEGHYLFVVSDGRTRASTGLTLRELAEFMQSLGAVTAYNLDGGGSSTMVFCGQVVNQPTTNGKSIKEREVSDIVCIVP